jgi:hypothetical protein
MVSTVLWSCIGRGSEPENGVSQLLSSSMLDECIGDLSSIQVVLGISGVPTIVPIGPACGHAGPEYIVVPDNYQQLRGSD